MRGLAGFLAGLWIFYKRWMVSWGSRKAVCKLLDLYLLPGDENESTTMMAGMALLQVAQKQPFVTDEILQRAVVELKKAMAIKEFNVLKMGGLVDGLCSANPKRTIYDPVVEGLFSEMAKEWARLRSIKQ